MAAISATNPSASAINEPPRPSTFTTIAPEIRNRIYELALNIHDVDTDGLTTDDADTGSLTTDDDDTDSLTSWDSDHPLPTYKGADTEVNLLKAEPPSKALLLTCRQINEEMKHMYRQAYRKFWSETKFCIIVDDDSNPDWYEKDLARFVRYAKPNDIPHIRNLRFRPNYPSHYWLADGLWYNGPFCNWEARVLEAGHMTHWKAFASKPGVLGRSTDDDASDLDQGEAEDVEDTRESDCLTKDEVVWITRWYIDYS